MHKQNKNLKARLKANKRLSSGFTIVELLIVVVVIAILAAITIVSYNGITSRAKESAALSNLGNVYRQVSVYQSINSAYPLASDCTSSPAANTVCLKVSDSTSYQYKVDNTVSPQTFCVTSWNGSKNYYVNQNNSKATEGICGGHIANGGTAPVIITNLSVNPSLAVNASDWSSAGSISSVARTAVGDLAGFSWAYSGNATSSGARLCAGNSASLLTIGDTYATTVWVKGPTGGQISWQATDSIGTTYGNVTTIGPATGAWQKVQFTFVPTAATIRICLRFTGASNFGNIYLTGIMLTSGNTSYNYADGNTSGWAWSGTPSNSTSTGPNTGL